MGFCSGAIPVTNKSSLYCTQKIVRILSGSDSLDHCRPLFINLKILTVINLYIYSILIHTKSNLDTYTYRKDIHKYNTRKNSQIDIPHHRLAKSGKSFKLFCIKFFNTLPETAQTANINNFKTTVYNWLIQNPFYSITEFLDYPVQLQFKN